MENLANLLLGFGVQALPLTKLLPVAAVIAAVILYLKYRLAPDGTNRSFAAFAVGLLLIGLVAGVLGVGIGVKLFCSYTQSNLCGLGGFFFTGPIAFSLAVSGYLFYWVKRGKPA